MARKVLSVLFDANVWRHVADAEVAHLIESICRRRAVNVLIAPSVVYEALRTRDGDLRARLARLMTRPAWRRLMPEAFEECEEFLGEALRLRPGWLATDRPCPVREQNRRDWMSGKRGAFWDRVRREPQRVAENVSALEGDTIETARADAREQRRRFLDTGLTFDSVDVNGMTARFSSSFPGWDGSLVAIWRASALIWASEAFQRPPYIDWLGELMDLRIRDLLHTPSWARFWLHDVEPQRMPRWWIRAACEILQAVRKVTDGTPCDAQLATYLFSCDHFLTYDRTLCEILRKCQVAAPTPMAATTWIPTGPSPIDNLVIVLDRIRQSRRAA
jgi:hypothetical protein